MDDLARRLVAATNAFDVAATVALFALDAVIEDVSVGDSFAGKAGVRHYIERFFVGYHTVTEILSVETRDAQQALVRVDFTGDFGHETGILDITVDAGGLITRVDADLD